MILRTARVLVALLVLNLTGCGLLELVLLPVKLLFDLLGGAASSVGLTYTMPVEGAAPVVENEGGGRWSVTGLRPEAPCTIVCASAGFESRSFAWPADFARHSGNVVVAFERDR